MNIPKDAIGRLDKIVGILNYERPVDVAEFISVLMAKHEETVRYYDKAADRGSEQVRDLMARQLLPGQIRAKYVCSACGSEWNEKRNECSYCNAAGTIPQLIRIPGQPAPNGTPDANDLICPFCGEGAFDVPGLKNHYVSGWCDTYEKTEVPR